MSITTSPLYRKAVTYVAKQTVAGADSQQIEWDLLNLNEFSALMTGFDIEELYDRVNDIREEGEEAAEDERLRVSERDAQRYEAYLAEYPELDAHREW